MATSPLISIVVPNYNHAPFLTKRLDSINYQSFQNFEIILLDDCSTDNSIEILKEFSKHPLVTHFIQNTTNTGNPFVQWAKGINLARGKYIWIAESDDYCSQNFLETLLRFAEENQTGITYCDSHLVDENGNEIYTEPWLDELDRQRWKKSFVANGQEEVSHYMIYRNTIINASAVLFERQLFPLNDLSQIIQLRHYGDWLIWGLISSKGNVGYISERLNYFRRHMSSVINRNRSLAKHRILTLEALTIIQTLRSQVGRSDIQPVEWDKYEWIISGLLSMLNKTNFFAPTFVFPAINGSLKRYYYQQYIALLFRKLKGIQR